MEHMNNERRFLEMLKAASPYVGAQARVPIHLIIQAGELSYQLHHIQEEAELAACDLEDDRLDMENMLVHIQALSSPRERESIQTMLNFIRAGKMLQAYQSFMNNRGRQMYAAGETDDLYHEEDETAMQDLEAASTQNPAEANTSSNLMLEFLMSQLSPEQKNNLDMLRSVMNMQNETEQAEPS